MHILGSDQSKYVAPGSWDRNCGSPAHDFDSKFPRLCSPWLFFGPGLVVFGGIPACESKRVFSVVGFFGLGFFIIKTGVFQSLVFVGRGIFW